jgi:MOSC domain-containing protein YiiM
VSPPGDGVRLPRDGRILKALTTSDDPTFGLRASVLKGGTVRVGDPARLL